MTSFYSTNCFLFPGDDKINIDNYAKEGEFAYPYNVGIGRYYYYKTGSDTTCRETVLYYYNNFRKDMVGYAQSKGQKIFIRIEFNVNVTDDWFYLVRQIFGYNLDMSLVKKSHQTYVRLDYHSIDGLNVSQFSLIGFLLSRPGIEVAVNHTLPNDDLLVDYIMDDYDNLFGDDLYSYRYSNAVYTAFAIVSYLNGTYKFEDEPFIYQDGLGVVCSIEKKIIGNMTSDLFKLFVEFVEKYKLNKSGILTPSHDSRSKLSYILSSNGVLSW